MRREKWLPLRLSKLAGVRGCGCGRRATTRGRRAQPAMASTREQWLRCSSYRSDGMLQQPSGGSPAVEEAHTAERRGVRPGGRRRAGLPPPPLLAYGKAGASSPGEAARSCHHRCSVVRAPWRRRRARPRGAAGSRAWRGGARPHATAGGRHCQGRAGPRPRGDAAWAEQGRNWGGARRACC